MLTTVNILRFALKSAWLAHLMERKYFKILELRCRPTSLKYAGLCYIFFEFENRRVDLSALNVRLAMDFFKEIIGSRY